MSNVVIKDMIRIDKNSKYIMLIKGNLSREYIEEVRIKVEEWFRASDDPILLMNGDSVELVKIHDTQDTSAPKPD